MSTDIIVIQPEQLCELWKTDDGLSVALLLDWLTDAEKDALAKAYTQWVNEHRTTRISLDQIHRSFMEVGWKLERNDLDWTEASQRVHSLVEQSGCTSRQAIITVLLQGGGVARKAAA